MRRFALALTLCSALATSAACGGAGEVPATRPEPIASATSPDTVGREAEGATALAEQTAAPSEEPPTEIAAPLPAEAAFTGEGPERPILGSAKGAQGPTEFPHWAHQRAEIKCVSCHHVGSGGRSCGRGAGCHQAAEANAPSAKDAFHGACRPCHKKGGFPSGCDFCHAPKGA